MSEEFFHDNILQLYISQNKVFYSLKTRLFLKQRLLQDLAIEDVDESIGLIVRVEVEKEFYSNHNEEHPISYRNGILFYKTAKPNPPTIYINDVQNFPLIDTIKTYICPQCNGTRKVTCPNCYGDGDVTCSSCGGDGDCTWCGGSGRKSCSCINDDDCPWCHGSGSVSCSSCSHGECSHCGGSGEVTCGQCHGSGEIICPRCHGDGELISYKVDVYTYKDLIKEENLTEEYPANVRNQINQIRNKSECILEFDLISDEIVKNSLGFINKKIQDKIFMGLKSRDTLYYSLKSLGGRELFRRDGFNIIPITQTKVSYPSKKKVDNSFWTLGTLVKASEQQFKLPSHPFKIITNMIFLFCLIICPILFTQAWDTQDLIDLNWLAFMKLIPVLLLLISLLLIVVWLTRRKYYKNFLILGTDNINKIKLFSLSALNLLKAENGNILDNYLIKYSKQISSYDQSFNPGLSFSYNFKLNQRFKRIRNIKMLNLNSRTFLHLTNYDQFPIQKFTDGYIILLSNKANDKLDQQLSQFLHNIPTIWKNKKIKLCFYITSHNGIEYSSLNLDALIPMTSEVLKKYQKNFPYKLQALSLNQSFLDDKNPDNLAFYREFSKRLYWLINNQ